jgi:hypothetical protein
MKIGPVSIRGYGRSLEWISVLGSVIALFGIFTLYTTPVDGYRNAQILFGIMTTFMGSVIIGGVPSLNPILRKIKISAPVAFFSVGVIILYVKLEGWEGLFSTSLSWLLGVFMSTGFIFVIQYFLNEDS